MQLLPQELLNVIRNRANEYDAQNRFCADDLVDLRASGYLTAAVPAERGGGGLNLTELSRSQRLLATHSPATALAVNMHLLWGAVARYLADRGDHRLDWVFDDMLAGEIFAFGISEAGNDSILLDSFTEATPDGPDYLLTGKKVFTTLSPVWSRLGAHARISTSETPEVIMGFIRRERIEENSGVRSQDQGGEGIEYPDAWNTLGMRATQSWNTVLKGARMRSDDVTARYEAFDATDPLIMAVSLCFGALTSSVYAGIADRALELAGEAVSLDDPLLATWMTEAILDHTASIDSLERLTNDVDRLVMRDDFSHSVAALKNRVTDEARRSVDVAIRITGSRAFAADSELARMYRDVIAGVFHPRSARSLAASIRTGLKK